MAGVWRILVHFQLYILLLAWLDLGTVLNFQLAGAAESSKSSRNSSGDEYYYYDESGENVTTTLRNSTDELDYSNELEQVESEIKNETNSEENRQLRQVGTPEEEVPVGEGEENEIVPRREQIPDQLPVESNHGGGVGPHSNPPQVPVPVFEGEPMHGPFYTDYNYNYGSGVNLGGQPQSTQPVQHYPLTPSSVSVPLLPNQFGVETPYGHPLGGHVPDDATPILSLPPPPPQQAPPQFQEETTPMKTEVLVVDGDNGDSLGVGVNDFVQINHHVVGGYDHNQHSEFHGGGEGGKPDFPLAVYHAEENPIVKAKEFLLNLVDTLKDLSTTDLVMWVEKLLTVIAELAIPYEHYVRVVSFAGIYLFLAIMYYGKYTIFDLKCDVDTTKIPFREYAFHAGRRFVPARTVDPQLQLEFLDLFRGVDEDDKDSSDELDPYVSTIVDHIEEMCPRDAFFYSLSPRHVEAYTALQRLFVAQRTPREVLSLANTLLHSDKIHPRVWYIGLVGAAMERPDMTGYSMAHPLDAIPDWYIPAHLITDLMRKYKKIKIRIKRSLPTVSTVNVTMLGVKSSKLKAKLKKKLKYLGASKPIPADLLSTTTPMAITTSTTTKVTVADIISASNHTSTVSPKKAFHNTTISTTRKPATITRASVTKAKGDKSNLLPSRNKVKDSAYLSNKTAAYSKLHYEFVFNDKFPLDDDDDRARHKKGKKKKGKKKKKKHKDECIWVDWKVGIDNGVENRIWYFREDMMVNQHHWYWHQTHPPNSTMHADRRAELFFFMHRNFIARYNAERLSNGLPRVTPLKFQPGGVIYEGYNSHMAETNSGIYWTPRYPQTPITDIIHLDDPDFARNITILGYLRSYNRLLKAIKSGKLMSIHGRPVRIDNSQGIEPLANAVEASDLSANPFFYDTFGIHNLGHIIVALAADPDYRFRRVSGVMAETAMSMRDPSFYPYHTFMDNLFEAHKSRLAPYKVIGGDFPLLWKGVELVKVELISQGGGSPNELRTFWTHHKFRLSPGVDRSIEKGDEKEKVCAQHLDHEPFHFKITIDKKPCGKSKSGKGTVRIFMAPRYDEKGKRIPLRIQRRLMFVMDVFPVKLKVGRNVITRYAEDSSLTQPWTKSLRDFERGPDQSGAADFCGCGWPQHLYIPKGDALGMAYDLFVMVTDYDIDYVPNDPKSLKTPETCNSPYLFCGLPRRRYPDARPMNYPFDRNLFKTLKCPPGYTLLGRIICIVLNFHREIYTLEEYVTQAPNMGSLKVIIKHLDAIFPEPARHR